MEVPTKPYACPICGLWFLKWGVCKSHFSSSVLCLHALDEEVSSASSTDSAFEGSEELHLQAQCRRAARAVSERQLQADSVRKRMNKACREGLLTGGEWKQIASQFPEVFELSAAVQDSVVSRFLAPGHENFRWIPDKIAWFSRCLEFSQKTISTVVQANGLSPARALVSALASLCLVPDSHEYYKRYLRLVPKVQLQIVSALHASAPIVEGKHFFDFFSSLCFNEECIHQLEARPPRSIDKRSSMQVQELKWTLYHEILEKIKTSKPGYERQVFAHLALAGPGATKTSESLVYTHAETEHERQKMEAAKCSLLHAAAASSHVRVCARLIAEGFEVNEVAGTQKEAPLHLAASRGKVLVVTLLIQKRAEIDLQDGAGSTPLHRAVRACVSSCTHAVVTHPSLQYEVCKLLLEAGSSCSLELCEAIAMEICPLFDLRNLICFHRKLLLLASRLDIDDMVTTELGKLQYETRNYAIDFFVEQIKICEDAAALEFCAFVRSDFIQVRDQVQRWANLLVKRLDLSHKAVDTLMSLPPYAAHYALDTWKLRESEPGVFMKYQARNGLGAGQPAQVAKRDAGPDMGLSDNLVDHIKSESVQQVVKLCRQKLRPWFCSLGLCEKMATLRLDEEIVCKEQVLLRIDLFIQRATNPLQQDDFSEVAKSFLYMFACRGTRNSVVHVSELLTIIELQIADMARCRCTDWTAAIATFLQRVDPVLYAQAEAQQRHHCTKMIEAL